VIYHEYDETPLGNQNTSLLHQHQRCPHPEISLSILSKKEKTIFKKEKMNQIPPKLPK